MSANLDGYLAALNQGRKLNKQAQVAADHLAIGARRGGSPAGRTGGERHRIYPNAGGMPRYGMGQAEPPCLPPGQTDLPIGTPVSGPCPPEFLCDCDLIGATTLGTAPVQAGTTRVVTVTDFDAVALQAVAIWFTAFEAEDDDLLANPCTECPTLISQVLVGQNGQLRVSGVANGLNSAAFAATREPVCVDWAPFRSQNGQELTIEFNNIVTGFTAHIFVVLWCNVLQ